MVSFSAWCFLYMGKYHKYIIIKNLSLLNLNLKLKQSIGFLAYFPHLNPYESLGNIGIFSKYLFTQHRALSITM